MPEPHQQQWGALFIATGDHEADEVKAAQVAVELAAHITGALSRRRPGAGQSVQITGAVLIRG